MMGDLITKICENKIRPLESLSDEELQKEIDRPFKPSFNPNFDFEKYCATLILAGRKIEHKVS